MGSWFAAKEEEARHGLESIAPTGITERLEKSVIGKDLGAIAGVEDLPPFSTKLRDKLKELEDKDGDNESEAKTILQVARKRIKNNAHHEKDEGKFKYASHE